MNENRSTKIEVRMSETEKATLQAAAEADGVSVSEYVRARVVQTSAAQATPSERAYERARREAAAERWHAQSAAPATVADPTPDDPTDGAEKEREVAPEPAPWSFEGVKAASQVPVPEVLEALSEVADVLEHTPTALEHAQQRETLIKQLEDIAAENALRASIDLESAELQRLRAAFALNEDDADAIRDAKALAVLHGYGFDELLEMLVVDANAELLT